MIILRRGDKLPIVAVLQRLLNLNAPVGQGPAARLGIAHLGTLRLDGDFGGDTVDGVKEFQRRAGLAPTGIVDPETWVRLVGNRRAAIASCLDALDRLTTYGLQGHGPQTPRIDSVYQRPDVVAEFERTGSIPAGMETGVLLTRLGEGFTELWQRLLAQYQRLGPFVLLRFFGHGRAGVMGVGIGTGNAGTLGNSFLGGADEAGNATAAQQQQFLANRNLAAISIYNWPLVERHLGRVRMLLHRAGSVEMHGCHVAGSESDGANQGRLLLTRLAELWGVPVSGSPDTQRPGTHEYNLRFEGNVETVFPATNNLAGWAQSCASYLS